MHMLSGLVGASAPIAKTAAGATAATGAVGAGAFSYNRANYLFDQGLRFGRYTTGYGFAIKQASMYREDIRDMTALSCSKQDLYHVVGVIFFVLNFQLIMAGRLGVHGPSPPGWLLGIYWANACMALMFLTLYNWLAMHASARAQAGGAFMLTRHVRLPIPTPKQLDKARKTGNSFERARATDMFRVPFVAPAPEKEAAEEEGKGGKARKVPRWHQSDEVADLHAGGDGARSAGATPEHFELYRGVQQEWWAHDAYARIGMLFFMSHWLTAASLYTMCHAFGELRAIWPAWSCPVIFCTAHRAILRCDIVTDCFSRTYNFKVEKIVPWTPMICALGMTLDYSVITPSAGWMAVIYALSWICYVIHVAWAIRMYDIASPSKPEEEMPEVAGNPWWPAEWHVPQALQNCLYLVAPPKRLEPGMSCLQLEMKAARSGKNAVLPKKAKEGFPVTWPWKLFRGALIVCIGTWVYICIGRVIEQVNGERMFLKQEGRVMRWPSHMQPWMSPWSRLGTRNEWCHTGGCDRRLSSFEDDVASRLVATLDNVATTLNKATTTPSPPMRLLQRFDMQWKGKQPPTLLASSASAHVALAASSFEGALVSAAGDSAHFVLTGLEGPLLGATMAPGGLLVTMKHGAVAECAGAPANGAWACAPLDAPLPSGGKLLAASVTRSRSGELQAALAFEGDGSVALFRQRGREWMPTGEVALSATPLQLSLSDEELVATTASGAALKWELEARRAPVKVAAVAGGRAVAGCGQDRLAHLTQRGELVIAAH